MRAIDQSLFTAVSNGDLTGIDTALKNGADLEAQNEVAMTPLTVAARDGLENVVNTLLDLGATVTHDTIYVASLSADCPPALVSKLQLHQMRQVKPITDHNSEPDANLLNAAFEGDLVALERAMAAGADVNVADALDTSALRWAARRGHILVAKMLLDAGCDVNQRSHSGWTALMEAVITADEELVQLLLEHQADVNARTIANASTLFMAIEVMGQFRDMEPVSRIIQQLKEHGAEYSSPDEDD